MTRAPRSERGLPPARPAPARTGALGSWAAVGVAALLGAWGAEAAELTVLVTGGSDGVARGSVFASEADWLKRPLGAADGAFGADGVARLVFSGLEPGWIAVSVFHDEDGDGELDTNFIGIPSEPVAASNNPSARFGPPSWEDSRFELPEGGVEITIALTEAGK